MTQTSRTILLVASTLIGFAACGTRESYVPQAVASPAISPAATRPVAHEDEMSLRPLGFKEAAAAPPGELRDRICDLSTRICDLAERDPRAADTMLKCQRARDACNDARSRVARACGG